MFSSVFDAIFWIAVASCALAQVAIVRSVLRMRGSAAGTGHGSSPMLPRARPAIEIAWVVVPALALAIVLALTWRTMHAPSLVPAPGHMHSAPTPVHSGD